MCSVLVSLFECNKNGLPLHQHASFKPHGNVDMLSTQHVYCCYDLRVRRSANVSNQSQQLRAWLTRTNTGNKKFASRKHRSQNVAYVAGDAGSYAGTGLPMPPLAPAPSCHCRRHQIAFSAADTAFIVGVLTFTLLLATKI